MHVYSYMLTYVRDRLLHRRSKGFFVWCNALMAMTSAEGLETSVEALQDGNAGDGAEPQRCHSWLPYKRRFCAAHVIRGLQYCGNHKPSAVEKRVPCPIDPSHTVLQEEVANHVRKCPALRQLTRFENQAYYSKAINAGSAVDTGDTLLCEDQSSNSGGRFVHVKAQQREDDTRSIHGNLSGGKDSDLLTKNKSCPDGQFLSSGSKRAAISALSRPDFQNLLDRIEKAFMQCCGEETEEAIMQPKACSKWLDGDRDRRVPYQEKHAMQQASLLGNLEVFGLLDRHPCSLHDGDVGTSEQSTADGPNQSNRVAKQRAILELGAGRGYLSHMLCNCYPVHRVVMVERRSYKFKADRTMRQLKGMVLERLRLDIEDLNLSEVPALQGCHVVGISKHLCGPATDLSLRCCLNGAESNNKPGNIASICQTEYQPKPVLDGLGIATCCHHLCQWNSYINKKFFRDLGLSKDDFHAITWLTSWALSGSKEHGLPDSEVVVEADELRNSLGQHAGEELIGKNLKPKLSEAMTALDATERVILGRKCKRLIDTGRLHWLREHGMQAKLVEYIGASVSPENKLLLAKFEDTQI